MLFQEKVHNTTGLDLVPISLKRHVLAQWLVHKPWKGELPVVQVTKGGFFSQCLLCSKLATAMTGAWVKFQNVKNPCHIDTRNVINTDDPVVISHGAIACKGREPRVHSVVESAVELNTRTEWASHFESCGPRGLKPQDNGVSEEQVRDVLSRK